MKNRVSRFRSTLILLALLAFIAAMTYLAGWLALAPRGTPQVADATLAISPVATLQRTPIVPFAQLDPQILRLAEGSATLYGSTANLPGIAPVGIYLPRTGDAAFVLPQPTLVPTPLPYPTSPPLPLPALPELPTLVPLPQDDAEAEIARVLPASSDSCAPSGNPVEGVLTQRYHRYHNGIDIGVPIGTPVLATHSGEVVFADWSTIGYGYLVILQSDRYITYYAHNTSFNVEEGMRVGKGSILAWSGSTGNSSGPHVHYETRIDDIPVDPLTFSARGLPSC